MAANGYGAHDSNSKTRTSDEDNRRTVVITNRELDVNNEAALALAEHDAEIFQRCGALVRIIEEGNETEEIKRSPIPRIDIISKETEVDPKNWTVE